MPDRGHFLWVPVLIWMHPKGPQKAILGAVILGCVDNIDTCKVSTPAKSGFGYSHIWPDMTWIYFLSFNMCIFYRSSKKKVYKNWFGVQVFLADHNVDTQFLSYCSVVLYFVIAKKSMAGLVPAKPSLSMTATKIFRPVLA